MTCCKSNIKTKKWKQFALTPQKPRKNMAEQMAEIIHLRIDQISAFDSVECLLQYRIGRCHTLVGERKNQYAMDLIHPHRLVFKKVEIEKQCVCILEIVDYH